MPQTLFLVKYFTMLFIICLSTVLHHHHNFNADVNKIDDLFVINLRRESFGIPDANFLVWFFGLVLFFFVSLFICGWKFALWSSFELLLPWVALRNISLVHDSFCASKNYVTLKRDEATFRMNYIHKYYGFKAYLRGIIAVRYRIGCVRVPWLRFDP